MGPLISISLSMIIAVVALLIAMIVGLFIRNIILFESIGIAIAAGCLIHHFFNIHPAFCLLIGIGALIGLYFLMNTKVGFWIIGGFMSLVWGFLVAIIVYDSTGRDMIWMYVSWGLVTLIVLALHLNAKRKLDV